MILLELLCLLSNSRLIGNRLGKSLSYEWIRSTCLLLRLGRHLPVLGTQADVKLFPVRLIMKGGSKNGVLTALFMTTAASETIVHQT